MPLRLTLGKFWKVMQGYGQTNIEGEMSRLVVPTIELSRVMANDFLVTSNNLAGPQAASTLIAGLDISTADRVGWWWFFGSITKGNSAPNRNARFIKGLPVLGSLLTVGSFIMYDMQEAISGTLPNNFRWMEPQPMFCPLGTRWEAIAEGALGAGESMFANLNAIKLYVE